MTKLITLSVRKIKTWKPCYSPTRYIPSSWSGNMIEFLKTEWKKRDGSLIVDILPDKDKIWLMFQSGAMPIKVQILAACWAARYACRISGQKDKRSLEAIKLAERYTNGAAIGKDELRAAAYAAADAAYAAAAYAAAADAAAAYAAYAAAYAAADAAYAYAAAACAAAADAAAAYAAYVAFQHKLIKRVILLLKREEVSK